MKIKIKMLTSFKNALILIKGKISENRYTIPSLRARRRYDGEETRMNILLDLILICKCNYTFP